MGEIYAITSYSSREPATSGQHVISNLSPVVEYYKKYSNADKITLPTDLYFNEDINACAGCGKEACEQNIQSCKYKDPIQSWPQCGDLGDDPSFYASYIFNSPITFGVCRRNLRKILREDDVILFFRTHCVLDTRNKARCWRYYFVGYATIDQLTTHKAIANCNESIFQKYSNSMLIKASDDKYAFCDWPGCDPDSAIARLMNRPKRGDKFAENYIKNTWEKPEVADAPYIIFHKESDATTNRGTPKTYILKQPLFVAYSCCKKKAKNESQHRWFIKETWLDEDLKKVTIGSSEYLRNRMHSIPHQEIAVKPSGISTQVYINNLYGHLNSLGEDAISRLSK